MSTIVFVLVLYIKGNDFISVTDFDTQEKCFAAAMATKMRENTGVYAGRTITAVCYTIDRSKAAK